MNLTEQKGNASVSWSPSPKHAYEDRYRLLPREVPLVAAASCGEIFAVFDGIGSAPRGMSAAQAMADALIEFFRLPAGQEPDVKALYQLLYDANLVITSWGMMPGTTRPLGGCAGTIAWRCDERLTFYHAGDTVGMLLRSGEMPRTLTKLHEQNGGIYRYFGLGETLEIDVVSVPVCEGDLILLMSDGVTKAFSNVEAANLVMEAYDRTDDTAKAAEALATRSRTRKSSDDITVVLVEVEFD